MMAKDKRIKICPNENCECYKKKMKYKASDEYCSQCNTKLVFVCAKCFREIEDIDASHRICRLCEAYKKEQKEEAIKKAKKVGAGVAALGTSIVVGIGKNVSNDFKREAIKKGTKAVKSIAKAVIKK